MKHPCLPLLAILAAFASLVSCGGSDDNLVPAEREKTSKNINANPTTRKEYARLEVPRIKALTTISCSYTTPMTTT